MIKEDYVSFEIAKLLKEKGFPLPSTNFRDWVFCMYDENGNIQWGCYHPDYYARVTLQMAMKWLREKHKLYIGINIEVGDIQMLPSYDFEEAVLGYSFVIYNEETLIWVFKDKTPRSYEKTVEAAIKYCLENLI